MTAQSPLVRVFCGPTIPHHVARRVLTADYRPPIDRLAFDEAVADGVDVAVIIDASFYSVPTATPTQILEALHAGMVVYGAASAGALRAVELASYGMRGVGGIFDLFSSGFEFEDELCVVFDPDSLRALSVPMINVRYAVQRACAEGLIGESTAQTLIDIGREVFFPDRTYGSLQRAAEGRVDPVEAEALFRFVMERGDSLDWKRRDAVECLSAVSAYVADAAA